MRLFYVVLIKKGGNVPEYWTNEHTAPGLCSPAVPVPQQQAHVVDDGGLSQAHQEARGPAVLLDGVPRETVVQVVVLRVSVQQGRLQLAFHHRGAVLHGRDVLLWN